MGTGVITTWGTPSWARPAANDITLFSRLDDEAFTSTTGVWASVPQACKAIIRETKKLTPNRPRARLYAKYHKQYQSLYPALQNQFDAIATLVV